MVTYLVLNILFLTIVLLMLRWRARLRWNHAMTVTLIVLLIATAVFDSLIIHAGIVVYDSSRILDVTVGAAPIEDFFYAALAVILIPNVWHALKKDEPNA